jgi:predicted HNH restriction endonuclease
MPANRRQVYAYKGDRCSHCGMSVQDMIEQFGSFARLFELNHVDPTKKDPNYENLIRRDISTEQLDEVDKCVLLCRNCHGIVHQQNINAKVIVHVMVEGRKMSQEFIKSGLARS